MAYVDIATLQTIAAGQPLSAATVSQIRDNGEFFIDPPACSIFNSAAQSVSDATPEALTANSENFDNDSMHSTASNTSRWTIQTAGRYLCFATVQFAADASGVRNVNFKVNGTTTHQCMQVPAVSAVNSCVVTAVRALTLAAGDYVEAFAFHTAGASLNATLLEAGATYLTR
jgi:hypothetical protein